MIVGVYQTETSELIRVAGVGLPLDTLEEYRLEALPWSGVTALLREEYRINQIHFVPQDGIPYTIFEPGLSTTLPVDGVRQSGGRKWLDGDKLLVVINDPDGKPLGLIQVDQPRDGMRPDKPTLESLEIFASQASLVIESHQRLDDLYTQIGNVQAELTSARSALDAKWTAQPIFQQNDTVIETSLNGPNQRSQRIQIALNIAELVNRQVSRLDVLHVFAQQAIAWMNFNQVLIAETHAGNPHLVDVLGTLPSLTTNLDILLGQRNPLKTTLQNGELLQVGNVNEDADWKGTPLLSAIDAKAFICLPIVVGASVDAAALLVSQNPLQPVPKEDVHLFELISRQVAIALENLRLLDETNRRLNELNLLLEFSRQLGSLDLLSIVRGLVESAIKAVPHAQAGMVALWQADIECLVPKIAIGYRHNERMLEIIISCRSGLTGKSL